jgi:hypothetical protein
MSDITTTEIRNSDADMEVTRMHAPPLQLLVG